MIPIYQKLLRPILFKLDAEIAHEQSVRILSLLSKSTLARRTLHALVGFHSHNRNSSIDCMGLHFRNRIGQAAGLDKDGLFPGISEALGFGHVEIGTVTPIAQEGNEKPRLFRFPKSSALINRMGFNNRGVYSLVKNIDRYYPKKIRKVPLGINIGKGKATPIENALDDYIEGYKAVANTADYITINISSPNTPNLRMLQGVSYLEPLLKGFMEVRKFRSKESGTSNPPCLVKISPDEPLALVDQIVGLILDNGFDGVIACNTSVEAPTEWQGQNLPKGGISGRPIEKKSTEIIRFINKLTNGKLPTIGSGGVHDLESAQRKLDAGASLIQIYSSMVFRGPLWPSRLGKRIPLAKGW